MSDDESAVIYDVHAKITEVVCFFNCRCGFYQACILLDLVKDANAEIASRWAYSIYFFANSRRFN